MRLIQQSIRKELTGELVIPNKYFWYFNIYFNLIKLVSNKSYNNVIQIPDGPLS